MAAPVTPARPGRDPLWLVLAVAALFQFVDTVLVTAGTSLFLRRVGPGSLPLFYVALNTVSVVFMLSVLARRDVSTRRLSLLLTMVLAGAAVVAVPFLDGAGPPFFFLLFLLIRLHDVLAFNWFLSFVQSVLPVREAKRRLAVVLGLSSGVCVAAGLAVTPLVAWFSLSGLFATAAAASAVLAGCLAWCGQVWPPTERAQASARPPSAPDGGARLREAFGALRTSSLAAHVVGCYFFTTLLRYLIEYQYSKAAVALFPDDVKLTQFVGNFKAGISLLVTVGQLLVTNRLLTKLKAGGTMALAPSVELGLCLLVVLWPEAVAVVALQAAWNTGFHVSTRPAFNILLVPLEASVRERVSVLASLAGALGSAASGVLLLVLRDRVPLQPYCAVLAVLYLAYLAQARRLNRDYLQAVERGVASAGVAERIDALEVVGTLGAGRDRAHLERLLQDDAGEVRLAAVRRLGALGEGEAEPLVLEVLERERDVRVLATLARELPDILGDRTRPLLRELIARAGDPRVTANALGALGRLGGAQELPLVEGHLAHPVHRIRVEAILALVRLAREPAPLARALDALLGLARSSEPAARAAAAAAMGELRHPCFAPCLLTLLDDDRAEVRRNAVRALGKLRAADALAALQARAKTDADPDVRAAAAEACRAAGDQTADELARLAGRLTQAERAKVAALLRGAGGGARADVLARLLQLEPEPFPADLVDRIRLCGDEALLGAAARALAVEPATLTPLIDHLERAGRTEDPEALALAAALARVLPPPAAADVVQERLRLVCLLHLAEGHLTHRSGLRGVAAAAEVRDLRRAAVGRLVLWTALLCERPDVEAAADSTREASRDATRRALEGAVGGDPQLASLSVELLEARLLPLIFRRLGPYLEAAGGGGRVLPLARGEVAAWGAGATEAARSLAARGSPEAAAALAAVVLDATGGAAPCGP